MLFALFEAALIGLIYIRVGQSFDPQGPFGLPEAERQRTKVPRIL